MLEIRAMDYDMLFGDDLIGNTLIDLEDRYFLPEWNAIKDKPVEYRCLHCPASSVAQGVIKLWVEINMCKIPEDEKAKVWDITAKPPEHFEIRVCIFDGEKIKMMDEEGTCDAFYRAYFETKDALETDTHFRNQDGKPSFNWRLIYKIVHPRKNYLFTVQCWDRDFFTPNEIVGSYELDLRQPCNDVGLTKRPLAITEHYYNTYMLNEEAGQKKLRWKKDDDKNFWVPMWDKNADGEWEEHGETRMQVDIMPADYAKDNPVGSARNDPNTNPFLPPPVGRLSFSLNPCKMFAQLVGPAARRKCYCYTCVCCSCASGIALIAMMGPVVGGDIMADMF